RKELDEGRRQLEPLPALKGPLSLKKIQARGGLIRRLEAIYFRTHEPEPVDPQRLGWFEEALPSWLDELIDPLPPEAARRRLTILYRLVFPPPEEMPAPRPEPTRPAPVAPSQEPAGRPPSSPPAAGPSPI